MGKKSRLFKICIGSLVSSIVLTILLIFQLVFAIFVGFGQTYIVIVELIILLGALSFVFTIYFGYKLYKKNKNSFGIGVIIGAIIFLIIFILTILPSIFFIFIISYESIPHYPDINSTIIDVSNENITNSTKNKWTFLVKFDNYENEDYFVHNPRLVTDKGKEIYDYHDQELKRNRTSYLSLDYTINSELIPKHIKFTYMNGLHFSSEVKITIPSNYTN